MSDDSGWYNSPKERKDNFKELKRRVATHEIDEASGPCALCGDPDVPVEYHNEDYGIAPFIGVEPALFSLCRNCHSDKLHKRFWRHSAWRAFVAHIRRGGYARDLKDQIVKKELEAFRVANERGEFPTLRELRPYKGTPGLEWFANLRMDSESLSDLSARPRP
jgi:hypothetical protein